jgi:hypothetical protein
MAVLNVPPSVREYLERLELELKQLPGVSPEEALADAREFLLADYAALGRSGEIPEHAEQMQWILDRYGEPKDVASQYAAAAEPTPLPEQKGYAPGWRICCTRCGRSAPLADLGGIRIGAKSFHKYTCSMCPGAPRSFGRHPYRRRDIAEPCRPSSASSTWPLSLWESLESSCRAEPGHLPRLSP